MTSSTFVSTKNLNAAKPPEQSESLGGNIGCKAVEKLKRKWPKSVFLFGTKNLVSQSQTYGNGFVRHGFDYKSKLVYAGEIQQ